MRKYLFLCLFFFFQNLIFAQKEEKKEKELTKKDLQALRGTDNKDIIYTKFAQGGFTLSTNGYSINFRRLQSKSAFFEHGLDTDLSLLKHPKEISTKVLNSGGLFGKSYIYGKMSTHFNLRAGWGVNIELADKYEVGSVELNYFVFGGLSLALLKPVVLEVITAEDGIKKEKYDPYKHTQSAILGATPFWNGIGSTKLYPGIYAKTGMNFDFALKPGLITCVELGLVLDYYFRKLPVMRPEAKNYSLYNAFYVSIYFGKKWN